MPGAPHDGCALGVRRWAQLGLIGVLAVVMLLGVRLGLAEHDGDAEARGLAVWRGMTTATVTLPGRDAPLTVRIADEPRERAQGMQYLPASRVREYPIWFRFAEPSTTRWHMRNVRIPLDIVWMGRDGVILGMARMEPARAGYRSPPGTVHALELAAGLAQRYGLHKGEHIPPPDPVR